MSVYHFVSRESWCAYPKLNCSLFPSPCPAQISTFLQHLRQLYRRRNTYHNFQHALDVFQATYFFLRTAGMVPPVSLLLQADARLWQPDKRSASSNGSFLSCLEKEDIFALYIAAVGHDVGHPGLTNAFLVRLSLHIIHMFC